MSAVSYKVDRLHVCTANCEFDGTFPLFTCRRSGVVHRCGSDCAHWFSTSESRVCRLTGSVVGSLDAKAYPTMSSDGTRVVKHWGSARKRKARQPGLTHAKVISDTLCTVFYGKERQKVYMDARNKFFAEARRRCRHVPCRLSHIMGVVQELAEQQQKNLRPPASPPTEYVNFMLRGVPAFWRLIHGAVEPNRKQIAALTAVIVESQKDGLYIGKHCAIRPHRFPRRFAPSNLQYSSLGVTCRSMSCATRALRGALTEPQTQQPRLVVFGEEGRHCTG